MNSLNGNYLQLKKVSSVFCLFLYFSSFKKSRFSVECFGRVCMILSHFVLAAV